LDFSKVKLYIKYNVDRIFRLVYYVVILYLFFQFPLWEELGTYVANLLPFLVVISAVLLVLLGIEFIVVPKPAFLFLIFLKDFRINKVKVDFWVVPYILLLFGIPLILSSIRLDFSFLLNYCELGHFCYEIIEFFSLIFLPAFIMYHFIVLLEKPKEFSFKEFVKKVVWLVIGLIGLFYFFP